MKEYWLRKDNKVVNAKLVRGGRTATKQFEKEQGEKKRRKKKKTCFKYSPNSISSTVTLRVINAAMRCWTGRSKVDSSRVDIAKLGGPRTHVFSV